MMMSQQQQQQQPNHNNINGNFTNKQFPSSARDSKVNGSISTTSKTSKGIVTSSSAIQKPKKPLSYETFAPRSQNQRNRLSRLQGLTSGPIPTGNVPSTINSKSLSVFEKAMIPEHQLGDKQCSQTTVIAPSVSTSSQDQDLISSTLQQARQTSQHISQTLSSTSKLTQTLRQTISLTQSLSSKHSSLLQHSSELSYNAEKLQSEYDMLISHANDIGLPLKHYDDVDRLGLLVGVLFKNGVVVKGIARVKVDDDIEFTNVLDCINDAILFFERRISSSSSSSSDTKSQSSSGSMEYYKRSIILQEAALDLLKEAIVNRINTTSSQIINALQLNNSKNSINGDALEASMIYTRFHGISSRTCHLMNMIYKRMNLVYVPNPNGNSRRSTKANSTSKNSGQRHNEGSNDKRNEDHVCPYTELWSLCRNSYISNRTQLLRLSIRNHLDFLNEKHGLIGMTRLASVFLMRLCTIETSLYLDFFGKDEEKEDIYDGGATNIEEEEAIPESAPKASSSSTSGAKSKHKMRDAASLASQVMSKDGTYYDSEFQTYLDNLCDNLHRTIRRGLVSVLDLDTLCQIVSVLREERSLANSSPTTMAAARSISRVIVDAQERLIFCTNAVLSKEVIRFKATPSDLDYPDKLRLWKEGQDEKKEVEVVENGSNKELKQEEALKQQMQIYESWFPPIRSVLKVLSKIFRVVEPNVFEDIALTSIQACSRSLKDGSTYIEKRSGLLHSDLFLVKNLLILREQLSPFDIQLRSVERQLDFSDAGKAVSRFIANRNRRLFSMTSENALVTLLSEGVSTREKSIDSKRDLEDALRSACNDFIEHASASIAGPLLTFVEQCKNATSSGGDSLSLLKSQSFMTGEYTMAVLTRALDRLEPEVGEINTQMSLYMDSLATRSILLKPVIRKITRLLDECRSFIEEGAVIDDTDRWNEQSKGEVLKAIDTFEKMVKSTSPRI